MINIQSVIVLCITSAMIGAFVVHSQRSRIYKKLLNAILNDDLKYMEGKKDAMGAICLELANEIEKYGKSKEIIKDGEGGLFIIKRVNDILHKHMQRNDNALHYEYRRRGPDAIRDALSDED